ncbi:LysR substrate-binding domain-containing protein [Salinibius halmophilus]|uniref:LysR substrate-binding domain-containing protein n=1 Tax=Salinibius halmophilus TaxID=1853216 RepID=UPI001314D5FD|nr:LysR substrate-binding domain-containing protein [Salinibius halmophilus]
MAHNPLSLDLLRALDAIDRYGSFAAAAERLHKVPSALSYTIQKVEADLELALFDRSGHKAKLTEAGHLVLEQGRFILDAIDGLADQAQQVASGVEAKVDITIDTAAEQSILWPALADFQKQWPFVQLELHHSVMSQGWEMLQEGKADILLTPMSNKPQLTGIHIDELSPYDFAFCAAATHPLALLNQAASEDELKQHAIVVIRDKAERLQPVSLGWLASAKKVYVATMEDKISAQVAGLGAGYLPLARIQAQLSSNLLVRLDQHRPPRHEALVAASRSNEKGPATTWLLDRLRADSHPASKR